MPRKKKKRPNAKKIVAIIVVALILLIIGGFVMAAPKKNNGWGIPQDLTLSIRNWVRQMSEEKNAEKGCCLPHCENTSKNECDQGGGQDWLSSSCSDVDECKIGCCQVDCLVKEDFPQDSCTYAGGEWKAGACDLGCCQYEGGSTQVPKSTCTKCLDGRWEEGECAEGFQVSMTGLSTTVIMGVQIVQELGFDLHTCEDTVFSVWTGTYTVVTNGEHSAYPFWVDLKEGWYSHTDSNGYVYEFSVTPGKMTAEMQGGESLNASMESQVERGYMACQKEL